MCPRQPIQHVLKCVRVLHATNLKQGRNLTIGPRPKVQGLPGNGQIVLQALFQAHRRQGHQAVDGLTHPLVGHAQCPHRLPCRCVCSQIIQQRANLLLAPHGLNPLAERQKALDIPLRLQRRQVSGQLGIPHEEGIVIRCLHQQIAPGSHASPQAADRLHLFERLR